MRHWRWYSKLLFALLVAAFAYFVWPTPWERGETGSQLGDLTIRIHRVTGRTQFLTPGGWVDFDASSVKLGQVQE